MLGILAIVAVVSAIDHDFSGCQELGEWIPGAFDRYFLIVGQGGVCFVVLVFGFYLATFELATFDLGIGISLDFDTAVIVAVQGERAIKQGVDDPVQRDVDGFRIFLLDDRSVDG